MSYSYDEDEEDFYDKFPEAEEDYPEDKYQDSFDDEDHQEYEEYMNNFRERGDEFIDPDDDYVEDDLNDMSCDDWQG